MIRYSRPNKDPSFYKLDEFYDDYQIEIEEDTVSSPEFDCIAMKLWMVRNFSKINHNIIEHKKHSNYMLNK